jgi:hypothetical protein
MFRSPFNRVTFQKLVCIVMQQRFCMLTSFRSPFNRVTFQKKIVEEVKKCLLLK